MRGGKKSRGKGSRVSEGGKRGQERREREGEGKRREAQRDAAGVELE